MRKKEGLLLALVLFAFGIFLTNFVLATTDISSCVGAIGMNTANEIYILTKDIATAGGSNFCLLPSAQNITIDCQGHKIKNGGVAISYAIHRFDCNMNTKAFLNKVTIKNCTFEGFLYDVYLVGGYNLLGGTAGTVWDPTGCVDYYGVFGFNPTKGYDAPDLYVYDSNLTSSVGLMGGNGFILGAYNKLHVLNPAGNSGNLYAVNSSFSADVLGLRLTGGYSGFNPSCGYGCICPPQTNTVAYSYPGKGGNFCFKNSSFGNLSWTNLSNVFTSAGALMPISCESNANVASFVATYDNTTRKANSGKIYTDWNGIDISTCSQEVVPVLRLNGINFTKINDTAVSTASADAGDLVYIKFAYSPSGNYVINYSVEYFNSSSWQIYSTISQSTSLMKADEAGSIAKLVVPSQSTGKIRINASIGNGTVWSPWVVSNNLTITNNGNSAPFVNWSMNDPLYLSVNQNNTFRVVASDEDDELSVSWQFGDGATANGESAIHGYSSAGIYNVQMCVKQETHNIENCLTKKVIVLKDGINVMPVVTSPVAGSVSNSLSLLFNISQSFVINCTTASVSNPPIQTEAYNCSYLVSPGATDSGIDINWNFGDGKTATGKWNSTSYNSIVVFYYPYISAGNYSVSANLSYGGASSKNQLTIYVGNFSCGSGNNFAVWQNFSWVGGMMSITNSKYIFNSSYRDGDCNEFYSAAGLSCCPNGYTCVPSGSGHVGVCISGENSYCYQYSNEISCNSATAEVAEDTIAGLVEDINNIEYGCHYYRGFMSAGQLCANVSSCSCVWNGTTDKCEPSIELETDVCQDFSVGTVYSCTWQEAEKTESCNSAGGKITVSYRAMGNAVGVAGYEYCKDQTKEYPCSVSVKIPFFSFANVAVCVVALAMIYAFLARKKKVF